MKTSDPWPRGLCGLARGEHTTRAGCSKESHCSQGFVPKPHLVGPVLFYPGPGALIPKVTLRLSPAPCPPPPANSIQGQGGCQADQSLHRMPGLLTEHMRVSSSQSGQGDPPSRRQGWEGPATRPVPALPCRGSWKKPLWPQSFHPLPVILTLYWTELLHRGKFTV